MQHSRRCWTNEAANSEAETRGNAIKQKFPEYRTPPLSRCDDSSTFSPRLSPLFCSNNPPIPLQRQQPIDTSVVTNSFGPKLKRVTTRQTLHFSDTKRFFQIRRVSSPAMADSTLPAHHSYGATTTVSSPRVGFDQRLERPYGRSPLQV